MGRSLTGATKGSQTLSYTYTPDGKRSSKTVNGTKIPAATPSAPTTPSATAAITMTLT